MQSVLAIPFPSSPLARAVTGPDAGPDAGPEADPCGGFSRLLEGGEAARDDEETADGPSVVEGVAAAAMPVLLWAGVVVKRSGADGPEPVEAADPIKAEARSGIRDTRPASLAPTEAALPLGDGGQLADGTGLVETVVGEPDQTADRPGAHSGGPGGAATRQAWGMADPVSQAAIPAVTASVPHLRYGRPPVDVPGQAGVGQIGTSPADTVTGGATGTGAGPMFGPVGIGAGLAAADPHAPVVLPVRTDATADLRAEIAVAASEGVKAGKGGPARVGMPAAAEMADGMVAAPEAAVQGAARGTAGGQPPPSFWERLLSGLTDAKGPAQTADDAAGPDLGIRPEQGPVAPPVAHAATPLPITPDGAVPAGSDPLDTGARLSAGGTDTQPALTAEPTAPGTGRPGAGTAPAIATATSGPHIAAELAGWSATDLRDAVPGLDPLRDGFDDPARFAVPGTASLAPQPAPAPAAAPVPMPQLAAQITAALTRGTDGETELALSPEELGHIRLKLKPDAANPERLVVMITFERPETLELFRRHAGDLADAFRAAGYAGADLGFGQQGSGQPDPRDRTSPRGFDGIAQSDPDADPPPSPRPSGAASLDLRL